MKRHASVKHLRYSAGDLGTSLLSHNARVIPLNRQRPWEGIRVAIITSQMISLVQM